MSGHFDGVLRGFEVDAKLALRTSPGYFMAWYTVKSIALVDVAVAFAYYLGRNASRNEG